MTAATGTVTARAGRREWAGLAVLALPTLLVAVDLGVLFLALPVLGADLQASSTQLLWISDVYGFVVAGLLVTMGALGDRIGRRRLLLIGAAGFGAASVLAAFASTPGALIAARALLGVAGATLMPSTLALISSMFRDRGQRATAIGLWGACVMTGVAAGPLLGGILLSAFWWGSVFLLAAPVMALLLLLGPVLLPEHRAAHPGRLDLPSAALSLAALLPVVYGLKDLAGHGPGPRPLLAVAAGLLAGAAFTRRQRHLVDPLLDLRLFTDRRLTVALTVLAVGAVGSGGAAFLFAQHLQLVAGLPPLHAALWMLPHILAMTAGSLLTPLLARRCRPGLLLGAGLGVAAAGLLLLTQVQADSSLALPTSGVALVFLGVAPTWVLGTDLIVGAAPPQRAGSAAALSETGSELGVALGIALLGSLSAAAYRHQLESLTPTGLPAGAARAATDTPAALPGQLGGAAVLDATHGALTAGLHVAAAATAAALVLAAVTAAVTLRHLQPGTQPPAPEQAPHPREDPASASVLLTCA